MYRIEWTLPYTLNYVILLLNESNYNKLHHKLIKLHI